MLQRDGACHLGAVRRHVGQREMTEFLRRVVRSALQLARRCLRFGNQLRRRHDTLEQAGLDGDGRVDRPAAQQHVHPELEADEARQALRAARARQQAETHLGKPELDLRIVGDKTRAAGHRQLEPTAEREAIDGSDPRLDRRFEPHQLATEPAAHREHLLGVHRLAGGAVAAHHREVGAGQKARLAGGEHDAAHSGVAVHAVHQRIQRIHQPGREDVHRPPRHVDRGEQHAVGVERGLDQRFHGAVSAQTNFLKSGLRRSLNAFTPSFDSSDW